MNETPKEFWNIYKYASFDIGEAVISNSSLKFTNPKYFNDPFDCDIAGLYFSLEDFVDSKVESEILQLRKDFAMANLSKRLLEETYKGMVTDKLLKSVATCFSLDGNNHLMWAHYANNHTGICLGFDNSIPMKERFTDLELGMEGELVYGFEKKINFCSDKHTGNQKLYFTKLEPWKYEREYRFIAIADEGIYHYKKQFLKSITFGLRAKDDQISRIVRLCKRLNLELEIFKTEIDGSNLTYTSIDK